MKKILVEQTYRRVDLARFEQTFFSQAFNDAICDPVGMRERQLVEETALDDGTVRLVTRWVAKAQLPKVLGKITGSREISYRERSIWDPENHTLSYEIVHPFEKQFQVRGSIHFSSTGDGVHQRLEAEVQVKIPGVRSMVERFLEGELNKAYELKHGLMQRYLDDHAPRDAAPAQSPGAIDE
jgi:hypothetical protein